MPLFDRFPLRYVVPNAVTCTSVVLGLWSAVRSMSATRAEDFHAAAWLILWAVILDKLDGALARRLRAASAFGVQLDSFSDFVTFGIAPAALAARLVPWAAPDPWASPGARAAALGLGALYVVAAALRLAKFNVTTAALGDRFFLGLPSTSSGGLLASAVLAHAELGLPRAWLAALPAFLVLNAALMVSNLPMPKPRLAANRALRAAQMALVAAIYVLIPLRLAPTFLVALATLYTLGGFAYGVVAMRRGAVPAVGG